MEGSLRRDSWSGRVPEDPKRERSDPRGRSFVQGEPSVLKTRPTRTNERGVGHRNEWWYTGADCVTDGKTSTFMDDQLIYLPFRSSSFLPSLFGISRSSTGLVFGDLPPSPV